MYRQGNKTTQIDNDSKPIQLKRFRELNGISTKNFKSPYKISAASGIIEAHNSIYVVIDDAVELGVFPKPPSIGVGKLLPLFLENLPSDPKERKKRKPDLESLIFLGADYFPPAGAILALPSGSKSNRMRGSLISFLSNGETFTNPKEISFRSLYERLLGVFPDLNIEGVVQVGTTLKLFQRGNGPTTQNATIDISLSGAADTLKSGKDLNPDLIRRIRHHNLGKLHGVALAFTDAYSSPAMGTWFLAAAESSESTFLDGKYAGSVIGKLDSEGEVSFLKELASPYKPEGLWIDESSPEHFFYVVTDADDPDRIAEMYRGILPSKPSAR
ncbi:MAG: hypothetical protein ABIQ95_05090 [Bdellovibrionia bacterium]